MTVLSWDEIAAVALHAGFPPGPAAIAVAITEPEAGRDQAAIQQGQPYATTGWGLWQITPGNSVPQFGINNALLNARNNALAAHFKWEQAGGFTPWTTYVNGLERPYLADAETAVAHVAHMTPKQIAALAQLAGRITGTPEGGQAAAQDWSPLVRVGAVYTGTAARHLVGYGAGIRRLRAPLRVTPIPVPAAGNTLWTRRHEERP